MRTVFPRGKDEYFLNKSEAMDFLGALNIENIKIEPDRLHVSNDGKLIYIDFLDKRIRQLPVRESFLYKLLKWYSFPAHQLRLLDIETVTSLLNDYLLAMKNKYVNVKIENGEALTITSERFTEVEDVELLKKINGDSIDSIYFTDYETSIRTKTQFKVIPFPEDEFGVGLNIVNSETGFKAFQINNYLLRYVCSNGSYVKDHEDDIKLSHYDLFRQDAFSLLEHKMRSVNDKADQISSKIKAADHVISVEKIKEVNKEIQRKLGIELLKGLILSDRQMTMYELFNIITDRAKDFPMYQRILLERIGGQLLN
ncbi:MAG: hypothetical protein CVV24_10105 [Ignavibacteriae bacterium HGW-Ignavibacteriae-3]|nr:MAG: hypothetical protein CVV24_10105 [Ignavibacteriae bacterium HGW-Ignavibacteriae-3]